ncbi:MAG: class I SAM-dependent methyltransferase, partial [Lysobacterales bacterium]
SKYGDRARVFVGNAERMDLPDASFDAVVEFNALHHIPGWRLTLREISRVLRPGGVFYLQDFLKGMTFPWWSRILSGGRQPVVFTGQELRSAIEEGGLQVTYWKQWREVMLQGRARKP